MCAARPSSPAKETHKYSSFLTFSFKNPIFREEKSLSCYIIWYMPHMKFRWILHSRKKLAWKRTVKTYPIYYATRQPTALSCYNLVGLTLHTYNIMLCCGLFFSRKVRIVILETNGWETIQYESYYSTSKLKSSVIASYSLPNSTVLLEVLNMK